MITSYVFKSYFGDERKNMEVTNSSSGNETAEEYNKRKKEEVSKQQTKDAQKGNDVSKVNPDYGKPLTIDGRDPATGDIIDPINLWENYETRTYAGKVSHGQQVYLVKREGDGVLIETKNGLRGWVTYFFIKEYKELETK